MQYVRVKTPGWVGQRREQSGFSDKVAVSLSCLELSSRSQSFTIIATNGEVLRSFVVRVGGRSVNAESWLSLPGKGEFVARRQKQKNPAAVFLPLVNKIREFCHHMSISEGLPSDAP